jgi:hypothetical protein
MTTKTLPDVDEDLNARFQERMKELETQKDMTIADRLFRRAMDQRMIVHFSGDPPIPVEIRVPLAAEFDQLLLLKHHLTLAAVNGDVKESVEYSDRIMILISRLCIDPSLNEEFLTSGTFGVDDALILIEAITAEAVERIKKTQSFRTRSNRKKSDAPLHETGEVSS